MSSLRITLERANGRCANGIFMKKSIGWNGIYGIMETVTIAMILIGKRPIVYTVIIN